MKTKIFMTALLLVLALPLAGRLQGQFTLSGEFRPRTEFRHGFSTLMHPEDDPAFFVSQRTRINTGLRQENYSFGFSLQDIRVWGEVPQLNRTDINSSVHEAWGEVRVSDHFSVKAGRQEIIYDNSRIFGNVDWAQQGRSHDAALVRWLPVEGMRVHAGFAFNQDSEKITGTLYALNNYKTFQYLWLNRQDGMFSWSFLFLNTGTQSGVTSTIFSQTAGGRVVYASSGLTLSGSAYVQRGKGYLERDLGAHYLAIEISSPLGSGITASGGFELLSGTNRSDREDPSFGKHRSFTPLFGTNHAFNGHMDYFYVGNHMNDVGLRDLYGGINYNPGSWSAGFRMHIFASDALLDSPGTSGGTMPKYLGTELDLFIGVSLFENATLRAGYSQMFASESMEVLKGGSRSETSNWAWLMLVLRPEFFNSSAGR